MNRSSDTTCPGIKTIILLYDYRRTHVHLHTAILLHIFRVIGNRDDIFRANSSLSGSALLAKIKTMDSATNLSHKFSSKTGH